MLEISAGIGYGLRFGPRGSGGPLLTDQRQGNEGAERQRGERRDGALRGVSFWGAVKGRPGEELMADLGEVVSRQAGRFQH